MNKLKCYILGIMTVILAIPIIEQITEIVCGGLEVLKGKNTKKVMQINKEIEDLQMQLELLGLKFLIKKNIMKMIGKKKIRTK